MKHNAPSLARNIVYHPLWIKQHFVCCRHIAFELDAWVRPIRRTMVTHKFHGHETLIKLLEGLYGRKNPILENIYQSVDWNTGKEEQCACVDHALSKKIEPVIRAFLESGAEEYRARAYAERLARFLENPPSLEPCKPRVGFPVAPRRMSVAM